MIFVTGGAYSGKREYVINKLGISDSDIADYNERADRAVDRFHLFIGKCLKDGLDPVSETEKFIDAHSGIVIIMDEVGCGIIPTDKAQRDYREAVGRAGCVIAKRAQRVIRVVCGEGMVIK